MFSGRVRSVAGLDTKDVARGHLHAAHRRVGIRDDYIVGCFLAYAPHDYTIFGKLPSDPIAIATFICPVSSLNRKKCIPTANPATEFSAYMPLPKEKAPALDRRMAEIPTGQKSEIKYQRARLTLCLFS
jgi:hypothetical protein